MLGSVDWKWLLIGLIFGWMVAPRVIGLIATKTK